ncbi:MAG: 50S ribosomal protein L7/L12 [Candidatus Sumerlaeota bacterium]
MTPAEVLEAVDNWTLLQINEFVESFCEKYNVSASAPVAVAAGPAAGGEEAAEEKDEFTVVLAEVGAEKIKVIKAIREINPSLGLKEAKAVADGAPSELATDVPKAEAEEMVKKLEEVGAKAELK